MGWWTEQSRKEELVIGDEPLDVVGVMLRTVVAAYEADVGRKPTMQEFAKTLELALVDRSEDIFNDTAGKEVAGFTIKVRKRPAKTVPAVGDYFAVPLSNGGYGVGRIEDIAVKTLLLVAFLDVCAIDIPDISDVAGAPVLFEVVCGSQGLANREWPVLGNILRRHPLSDVTEEERFMDYQCRLGGAHGYLRARELLEEQLGSKCRKGRRFPWS